MKLITCASYYGTGSSAITDLLGEFEDVHFMGDYEFRFIQDPEGISDLEYNLVQNQHRHNSGHALKRYKKMVNFLNGYGIIKRYEPFFNNKWKTSSNDYIAQLTDFTYKGSWHYDLYDRGISFYVLDRLLNKTVGALLRKVRNERETGFTLLRNEITYASAPSEAKFLDATRRYIDDLFDEANDDNKTFVMADQLVPPSNLKRYLRYFNDVKVIVVDRDPRDLFLLEKLYWKGGIIPHQSAELFCNWFKHTRKHRKTEKFDHSNVLFVQFEDLIYNYVNEREKICSFIGVKGNCSLKKYFDPDVSVKNTNLFKKHKDEVGNIDIIERGLNEYCYEFPI